MNSRSCFLCLITWQVSAKPASQFSSLRVTEDLLTNPMYTVRAAWQLIAIPAAYQVNTTTGLHCRSVFREPTPRPLNAQPMYIRNSTKLTRLTLLVYSRINVYANPWMLYPSMYITLWELKGIWLEIWNSIPAKMHLGETYERNLDKTNTFVLFRLLSKQNKKTLEKWIVEHITFHITNSMKCE